MIVHDAGVLSGGIVQRLADVFERHLGQGGGEQRPAGQEHAAGGEAPGMGFAVYREGRPLVQLYGGEAAPGRAWDERTLAVMFSGTKGITATLAAILADRGLLDPEAPVAEYWPEFAAAGKADVRVSQVLSHTVGLLYVDPDPDGDERYDNRLMARRLAAQPTLWQPGTKVAYHAITYGYLMAEILLRVSGKSIGELVHSELAAPFGLDLHLGLPASEEARVATITRADNYRISTFLKDDPERRAIVDRMYGDILTGEAAAFNTHAYHEAELAAASGIGSADAMAKLYSLLISPQAPIVPKDTLGRATRAWSGGPDAVNDRPLRFGLGYELDDPIGSYGPVEPAFGHSGAGGGLHGAWPGRNLAFSFLPGQMQSEDVDTRAKELLDVLALAAGE
jgi:CubicO group peptidase (beta-lactamase class C family)